MFEKKRAGGKIEPTKVNNLPSWFWNVGATQKEIEIKKKVEKATGERFAHYCILN